VDRRAHALAAGNALPIASIAKKCDASAKKQ
jgi:hypothetical protein